MDQNYWDIDSILSDNQKLPCTFNLTVPNLGHLESNDERDVKQHARLELPFWLAELLALNDVVSISMPKAFGPRVRGALDANAQSVQLRNLNIWWYALGLRLGNLIDSTDLLDVLSKTYTSRLPQIYEQSQHLASMSGGGGGGGGSGGVGIHSSSSSGASSISSNGMTQGPPPSMEMVEFLNGLDESEKLLLRTGQEAARIMKDYLAGSD
ncbi:GINS complex, Psf3 component [Violaceomyces palustris]|uniref:GINS complex, Psf3 component n=1 Tax=Violaceomyces palustris TaxID=1673888 RepID=A0ACD0P6L9_9BASI|nr:GINS complex, Psf3 component [Violaceomyces palustris]